MFVQKYMDIENVYDSDQRCEREFENFVQV